MIFNVLTAWRIWSLFLQKIVKFKWNKLIFMRSMQIVQWNWIGSKTPQNKWALHTFTEEKKLWAVRAAAKKSMVVWASIVYISKNKSGRSHLHWLSHYFEIVIGFCIRWICERNEAKYSTQSTPGSCTRLNFTSSIKLFRNSKLRSSKLLGSSQKPNFRRISRIIWTFVNHFLKTSSSKPSGFHKAIRS